MLARRQGRSVSELLDKLPPRHTASDRLKAFPGSLSQARIAALRDGGAAAIEAVFGALSLGGLTEIDETDGLRMTFASGEVVHLRASGNAPELRCYNEADDPERVRQLNHDCMALLEGWREDGAG